MGCVLRVFGRHRFERDGAVGHDPGVGDRFLDKGPAAECPPELWMGFPSRLEAVAVELLPVRGKVTAKVGDQQKIGNALTGLQKAPLPT